MYKLFHQWCIYFRCLWFCVCVFVSVCVIESTTLCITYYFLCLHSKERKQQSSEEAVHRPSVCLSLRWYKRVMCMLLFCAQFFEALIFAIHIDIRIIWYITRTSYMAYETTDIANNSLQMKKWDFQHLYPSLW